MTYDFINLSVVVVESNKVMYDLVRSVLETFGIKSIYAAYDAQGGYDAVVKHQPDLVIIDWLSLPNGTWLIHEIRQNHLTPNPFAPNHYDDWF